MTQTYSRNTRNTRSDYSWSPCSQASHVISQLNNEMAVTDFINNLIYRLFVFLILINEIFSYEKILLEESRLCKLKPNDPDVSVHLSKEKNSVKVVTQKTYFARWTGRYNFICSFSIYAPENYGIYAVVQALNFRRNETTGKCSDFVHFYVPQDFLSKILDKGKRHEKYLCGRMYAGQSFSRNIGQRNGDTAVAKNGFVAPEGRVYVTIYVAQQRLLKDEELEIKIAFTSYKRDCNVRPRHKQCKRCEWIWEGLFTDSIQNCPYVSCLDADNCEVIESPYEYHDVISNGTGTKVTVGAVSAIMITFFFFTMCLCACRRSQKCCWQIPPDNSVRVEMNPARPNAGEELVTTFPELPSDTITPSAPVLNDAKDVPPSYESLFPSK